MAPTRMLHFWAISTSSLQNLWDLRNVWWCCLTLIAPCPQNFAHFRGMPQFSLVSQNCVCILKNCGSGKVRMPLLRCLLPMTHLLFPSIQRNLLRLAMTSTVPSLSVVSNPVLQVEWDTYWGPEIPRMTSIGHNCCMQTRDSSNWMSIWSQKGFKSMPLLLGT